MERLADRQTGILGGVDSPTKEELARMQRSDYVLRGRDGRITEVPAEKAKLPHDPKGHVQAANVALTADGTLYVAHSEGRLHLEGQWSHVDAPAILSAGRPDVDGEGGKVVFFIGSFADLKRELEYPDFRAK